MLELVVRATQPCVPLDAPMFHSGRRMSGGLGGRGVVDEAEAILGAGRDAVLMGLDETLDTFTFPDPDGFLSGRETTTEALEERLDVALLAKTAADEASTDEGEKVVEDLLHRGAVEHRTQTEVCTFAAEALPERPRGLRDHLLLDDLRVLSETEEEGGAGEVICTLTLAAGNAEFHTVAVVETPAGVPPDTADVNRETTSVVECFPERTAVECEFAALGRVQDVLLTEESVDVVFDGDEGLGREPDAALGPVWTDPGPGAHPRGELARVGRAVEDPSVREESAHGAGEAVPDVDHREEMREVPRVDRDLVGAGLAGLTAAVHQEVDQPAVAALRDPGAPVGDDERVAAEPHEHVSRLASEGDEHVHGLARGHLEVHDPDEGVVDHLSDVATGVGRDDVRPALVPSIDRELGGVMADSDVGQLSEQSHQLHRAGSSLRIFEVHESRLVLHSKSESFFCSGEPGFVELCGQETAWVGGHFSTSLRVPMEGRLEFWGRLPGRVYLLSQTLK